MFLQRKIKNFKIQKWRKKMYKLNKKKFRDKFRRFNWIKKDLTDNVRIQRDRLLMFSLRRKVQFYRKRKKREFISINKKI